MSDKPDMISRAAALNARTIWFKFDAEGAVESVCSEELPNHDAYVSIKVLRALPAAQVAVKPGEIERAVWSAMGWAANARGGRPGDPIPPYTDSGNSDAETECRRATARIRSGLTITPAPDPAQIRADALRDCVAEAIDLIDVDGNEWDLPARLVRKMREALIPTPPSPAQDISSFVSPAVTTPSEPGRMEEGDTPATPPAVSPDVAALVDIATAVLHDVDDLIANSEGVAGLHQNGDVADWESLLEGGQFEGWLQSLEAFRAALGTLKGGE